MLWNNLLSCIITDDLGLKRLRFEDMNAEADSIDDGFEPESGGEEAAQKFDQDFALMTLGLSSFFKSLFPAFGGLEDPRNKVLPDNRKREHNHAELKS